MPVSWTLNAGVVQPVSLGFFIIYSLSPLCSQIKGSRAARNRLRSNPSSLERITVEGFRCFFIIIPSWSCMNGNPVTDSEFHFFTVNHVEGFELFIHLIDIPKWFPDKYCFTFRGFHPEFRLEYPRRILILIGTDLIVHQKEGYQTRVIG